jgi:transglutaminase-like putative cysteine protease
MTPRRREIETLLLTSLAAVPLYVTQAIGFVPLMMFHVVMAGIILRVALGKSPELIPAPIMRAIAVLYVGFYVLDAAVLSRNAIAASTHLVLFIATYQPIESARVNNQAQRLLTTALIFIASIATSTHITIVLFVIGFAFVMFRQLMYVSHLETVSVLGREYAEPPSSRAAAFYLAGTSLVAALLFPIVPRVRNPFVHGGAGALTNATTGLSDSIDFNHERTSTPDPSVVARVWMGAEAIPFFTPVRLRGAVYDRFSKNEWLQTPYFRSLRTPPDGVFNLAKPVGFVRSARLQQQVGRDTRLFIPVGTYAVSGITQLFVGPREAYSTPQTLRGNNLVTLDLSMARATDPLRPTPPKMVDYPVTPAVSAMARNIVGNNTEPLAQAAAIERYLSTKFQYVADPAQIGRKTMTVDEFLLRQHRGHCEYFAAGMVALLTAREVPARIAGGFYGGRYNPLTGYFIIRREDAHAWVEVWNGTRWTTFDPTPAALRPGSSGSGLLRAYATAIGDSVTYFWDRYVLTYGLSDQIALAVNAFASMQDLMRALRGFMSGSIAMITSARYLGFVAALLIAGALAAGLMRSRRPVFDLLAAHLRRLGIVVSPSMTMEEALAELRARQPDAARDLEPIIALYEEERFSPKGNAERRRTIRRRLAEIRA